MKKFSQFGHARSMQGRAGQSTGPGPERTLPAMLPVNLAGDERDPPEPGITERELGRVGK